MKNRFKLIKEALIPASVVFSVFMGILALKGIFPFGPLRIDYYDMGQTNAPLYYHIWDVLHGKSALFYSWYINEGQNLAMGSSIQWNISIFNLFFLLIKRSSVLKSLSVFMGIHLFFMAFNMYLFLGHTLQTSKIFRIFFAVAYGLTGFTLTHYTIPTYLDTAALMPIWLITLHDLLTSGEKTVGKPTTVYALITGYMTAMGYYLAFMNLIFILLISGSFILLLCGKEHTNITDRRRDMGRAAVRLGIGTFSGIGLSAVVLFPSVVQMMESSRFNSNLEGGFWGNIREILWAIGADMYYIKWWLLSGSIMAITILIGGLFRFRKEKRITLFLFLFCMYPCALIPFESINLMWHMGTYYHYPIRCGYLIPIVLLTTGAYYVSREEVNPVDINIRGILLVSGLTTVSAVVLLCFYQNHAIWEIEDLFGAWTVFALILATVYSFMWYVIKRPEYLFPVLLMELFVSGYIGYGQPQFIDKYSSEPEQSGDYIVVSQVLMDDLGITESRIERVKNPDTTLNTNYGFIMRRATVGGWANTVSRPQMDTGIALGYGAHFMRILDCGGTLLSDAALHVTETLTANPMLYSDLAFYQEGEADGFKLYRNKYTLPFIMKVSKAFLDQRDVEYGMAQMSLVDATNYLYRMLASDNPTYDDSDTIIRDISEKIKEKKYHVNGIKAVYLQYGAFDGLRINGNIIPIPDITDSDSTTYPGWFNSNLVFLGVYNNEDLEVENYDADSKFYEFDMAKLGELCKNQVDDRQIIDAQKSRFIAVTEGRERECALIPIAYDKGFTARVNGEKREIINVDNLFMAVSLDDGPNDVQLSFMPRGAILGGVISLVSLISIILFSIWPVRIDLMYSLGRIALISLSIALIAILYLIPYIAFVIHQFEKRVLQ